MTAFIILGCPRSGTSLAGGILHKSGIPMGGQFAPAGHPDNIAGFYEDLLLTNALQEFLVRAGGDDLDWPDPLRLKELNAAGLDIPGAEIDGHINACIRYFIKQRTPLDGSDWGFKDPRMVIFWPMVEHLLPLDAKIIITHRNPLNIARSWLVGGRRESIPHGLRVVINYEARLRRIAQDEARPVFHLSFEDWWHAPEMQLARLVSFVGRPLKLDHFRPDLWRS